MNRFVFSLLFCLVCLPAVVAGQDTSDLDPQTPREVLHVFLDCNRCDFNNLRQDITFINYVRDRQDADVHVLVSTQRTGSGGEEYHFDFIGLGPYSDLRQQITMNTGGTDTDDEQREAVARTFSLGLTPFLLRTPNADRFSLRFTPDRNEASVAATPVSDPWNFWIFRVGFNTNVDGEETRQNHRFNGNLSANRTTREWKLSLSGNGSFNQSDFTLNSGEAFTSTTKNYNINTQAVKSLGDDHWGLLMRANMSANSQRNQDRAARLSSGIEYNFFSYEESTRRSFVVQYSIGTNYFNYSEVTIFDKLSETAANQRLSATLAYRQPWGTSRISSSFEHYLNDASKSSVDVNGRLDIRLFRGFNLNVSGNASRVRDQLYLPAGEATDEEILLRIRQLATGYRYRFEVGFNFQFGSIYNNVVNPRWGGGGGG